MSVFKLQTINGGADLFNVDPSGNTTQAGAQTVAGAVTAGTSLVVQNTAGSAVAALTLDSYDSGASAVATGGAATTLSAVIPAGVLIVGWTILVSTTIAGIDSTTGTLTVSGGASATLGTISAFSAGTAAKGATATATTAATNVVFTLSGGADNTPSGGAIRVVVWYTSCAVLA